MATSTPTTYNNRIRDLLRMYKLLDELATRTHSPQQPCLLSELQSGGLKSGGVYFFYEDGEHQSDSGAGDRIVHVGQSTTLRSRLLQHKHGNKDNSIFRKLVGHALEEENKNKKPPKKLPQKQFNERVTETLGNMWVLCLPIEDKALHDSIKRNAIALLSNYNKQPIALLRNHHKHPIDLPSKNWLGHHCGKEEVRESGLWNQDYVGHEEYDSDFLDTLKKLIRCL